MNNFKIFLSTALIFLCCLTNLALAQTTTQSTNADDYSDTQLKQLMQRAQASGMSDAEILQQAKGNGMSDDQIKRFQTRISDLRNSDNGSDSSYSAKSSGSGRKLNYAADSLASQNQNQKVQSKIFGSSLFRNSNNNSFAPNLRIATPVNYIVGPDDRLQINLYGNSVNNWNLEVSPEGNINIPGVGVINVSGKTIEQATANIKSRLSVYYAIGKGTNVSVNLGNIRSIQVVLQGQLVKPGTYTLPSLSTIFNALYVAQGPSDIGTFRKIQLIRNDKVIRTLDLYNFLLKGSRKDDISLRDQDIINVSYYGKRVELKGEIKVPALYELLPGETLQNVLNFSGGFTEQAYTARIKTIEKSDRQRRILDVFEKDFTTHIPLSGDIYTVDKILDRFENRVTINGAVFRPGEFELQKGLTISQLISNAGGLKEDAFTGRGSIVRLNPDNSTQFISFNIADILNKKVPDIQLQREDNVTIVSVLDLRGKYNVTIKGEVRRPGEFAYADSMQVSDLIIRAGGFAEGASAKRIEVSRRIFNSDPNVKNSAISLVYHVDIDGTLATSSVNFTLQPYDIVSVYSLPGYEVQKYVRVEGEVIYPGNYVIQTKNEKISDLVKRAGGLSASADVEGSSLKRDNSKVLGVDKSKIDTAAVNKERADRLKRLQHNYKDSTLSASADTAQFRNNYIGIDLKKILEKPGTGDDLILENGDVLRVPKQQQTVNVNGEVLYPSAIVYAPGKTFRGYVLNAGGFSPNALKGGAYVVYPNGTVKGTRKFLFFNIHPGVKAGSEIFVPTKTVTTINTLQTVLGFTTGLASLGAIILGLLSLHR